MKTNLQIIILSRLENEFGVDVTPAAGLVGDDLDRWLFYAEDAAFNRQMEELRQAMAQGCKK
jgi:hypothetical protein